MKRFVKSRIIKGNSEQAIHWPCKLLIFVFILKWNEVSNYFVNRIILLTVAGLIICSTTYDVVYFVKGGELRIPI